MLSSSLGWRSRIFSSAPARWADVPTSEIDIWRSARLLVDQHGDTAAIEAAMRADALLDEGDLDGYAVWRRIVRAVRELLDREPVGTVH